MFFFIKTCHVRSPWRQSGCLSLLKTKKCSFRSYFVHIFWFFSVMDCAACRDAGTAHMLALYLLFSILHLASDFFFNSLTGGCYPLKSTQTITTVVIFKQPGHSDRMLIYKKKYILFFQATLLFSGCIIYVGGPEKGMKLTCLQNLKKPME